MTLIADTRELPLREGDKFSCLVASVRPMSGLPDLVDIGDQFWYLNGLPADLCDIWQEPLGTLAVEAMRDANFCLLLRKVSANPADLDAENERLAAQVALAFNCVLLGGIPQVSNPVVVSGARVGSWVQARRYRTVTPYWGSRYAWAQSRPLTERSLRAGVGAFLVLDPAFDATDGSFMRIRRGFAALVRAMHEYWPDVRLHQYVRAIEALTKTDKAGDFARRCELLSRLCDRHVSLDVLQEIYSMRSCAEHLNDWTCPLGPKGKPGRSRKALSRLLVAEDFALSCWRTALTNPVLFQYLRDDSTIKELWRLLDP